MQNAREQLADSVQAAVNSLSSIQITITATQGDEVLELFNIVAQPVNKGLELETEVEYRGDILGALMSAYLFHKAEELAKMMVKNESEAK